MSENPTGDDFAAQAVEVAFRKMFRADGYFDICTVDVALKSLNRVPVATEYNALRVLHCVHWRDMPPGMPEVVMRRTLALFTWPGLTLERIRIVPKPAADVEVPQPGGVRGFLRRLHA